MKDTSAENFTPLPQTTASRTSQMQFTGWRVRQSWGLGALGAGLILAFFLSIVLGSVWVPVDRVIDVLIGAQNSGPEHVIIRDIRLPGALTALLAGAALGIAGLQMQTLLRNPLADPFALGVAPGASLGVALVLLADGAAVASVFGSGLSLAGDALVTAASIAGAAAALVIVLALSSRVENPVIVLILGLMFGYAASAFVTVLVAGTDPDKLQRWVAWGFGSFSGVTWQKLSLFAPVVMIGLALSAFTTKQLNVLLLGENYARSMGLHVRRMRLLTMAGASILGGVVTAFCGPVAFLGVAIPHLCRAMLRTSDHRVLVPATILMGGVLALVAQMLSLIPGNAGVLPLNAVTALIGAPVVVMVIMRSRKGPFAL